MKNLMEYVSLSTVYTQLDGIIRNKRMPHHQYF